MTRALLLCVVLSGCGASTPARPTPLPSEALEAWRGPAEGQGAAPVRVAPRQPMAIRARTAARRPPLRSGRRVDVDLHRAPLADALTLLAEAAGRSLVCEPDLGATVSVRLRNVDPLRAMRALAEAHGIEVAVASGVLLARPRQPLNAAASAE